MTCIIGLVDNGKVYMAGDSIGYATASDAHPLNQPKVHRVKDKPIMVGFAGSIRSAQILEYNPQTFPKLIEGEEYNLEYLITKFIQIL